MFLVLAERETPWHHLTGPSVYTHITTNLDRKWETEREHELVPSRSNALWDLLLLLLLIPVHWRAPRSETEEETDRLSEGTG